MMKGRQYDDQQQLEILGLGGAGEHRTTDIIWCPEIAWSIPAKLIMEVNLPEGRRLDCTSVNFPINYQSISISPTGQCRSSS
jgi:hypothetical protein